MNGYPTRPLGQVARLLSGGTPSKSNASYWNGTIPWLTPKDMGQWEGKTEACVSDAAIGNGARLAPANSAFVAVRGMSLHNEIRVVRSPEPITFNQDIKAVVAGPEFDARFLYYVLTAAKPKLLGWVSAAGHGTGVLATDRLLSLEVPDLPVAVQQAIASTVGDIDDKIELNRRMSKTLEAMAQAIFRDWFVDFGPVRRKLKGETDPVTILGGLIPNPTRAAEIAEPFPDALGDDGLPTGWEWRPIGELARIKGGKQLKKEEFVDSGLVPVFGGAGHMGQTDKANAHGYVITVGRVGAYCGNFVAHRGNAWVNNNASYIRPNVEVPAEWLFLALNQLDIEVIKKGAAQPFISNGDLANMLVVWPGADRAKVFQNVAQPLILRGEACLAESYALAETRDYLLPRLVSGKVHIRDAAGIAR